MIGEFNIDGVFLPALLVWALVALLGSMLLRRVLRWAGFYRLVWHPVLFDVAIFIVLVGGVVSLASTWIVL